MIRSLVIASLFVSTAAFATGERISVTGAAAPLKETLCISMNCVSGGGVKDFIITGRAVKGGVEVTVTSVNGQPRLTTLARVNEYNQISSTELVHATSLVVQSIEKGPIAAAPVKKAVVASKKKALKRAFLARR